MPTRQLAQFLAALLLLFTGQAMAEPIDWDQIDPAEHTFDNWYLDTAEGQPIGYWHSSMTIKGDTIVSQYHEHSVESHGGELSTYTHKIVWTETTDFKPITVVVTTAAGSDEVTKTYRFVQDGIELTSEQNGRQIHRKLPPIKGDYLTSAQQSIATDLGFESGDETFTFDTLDISVGLNPYVTTYTKQKSDAASVKLEDGSVVQTTQWNATYSVFPGFEMEHWIDRNNQIVALAYKIDAMQFGSTLSNEKVVERKFDPPEMSGLSVVVPDKPIKDVGRQKKIVYELNYSSGDKKVLPITTSKQSVELIGNGKARVVVDLSASQEAEKNDQPADKYLTSSIMIDHEDKLVRQLATKATRKLKKDASDEEIALACKRFVTMHIRGASLSVGDGSASEAARTREGDCTECSVLLAALLRVHGIPSRCVTGLVYSEDDFVGQQDVFVYHMWTQAWIEKEPGAGFWLDLDSAIWRYSAGHIALGTSAMGDDDQQDLIDIVPMQQDLTIKVLETKKGQ